MKVERGMRVDEMMQREVATVEPEATLQDAARMLRKWQASALMVMKDDRPVGILTERDLVQVVGDGENPAWNRVSTHMATDLVTVGPDLDCGSALAIMSEHAIRHLPVVDDGRLVGLVSLDAQLDRDPATHGSAAPKATEAPKAPAAPAKEVPRFRGPYADGPPDSALVVDPPSLTGFGFTELRRMAVVGLILTLTVLRRLIPSLLKIRHRAPAAAACRGLIDGFEALGPTYVKLGQLIASSPGIFPKVLSDEAMHTLDEVPPFDGKVAKEIIRKDLGRPVAQLFLSFDQAPLAAASVGQVHACVLPDGRDAVVKLQRPNIHQRMGTDLRIMYRLAKIVCRFSSFARSSNVLGIVEDLHHVTFMELNPVVEAHRQTRFRNGISAFGDNKWVTAPEVFWDYCGPNMICMERMYGIPVDEFDTLRKRGIDCELVLRRGVKVWMEAALVHGAFHGDVHSGNLWMLEDGRLAFLDFGIMGELEEDWKQLLRDQFTTTMLDNDFSRVARAFKRVGAFPEDTGTDEEVGLRMQLVFGAMLDSGLSDVNLGELLSSIVALMDQYSKEGTPRELVLVIKQLLYFERYAKELAPKWLMFRDLFLMKNVLGEPVLAAIKERGLTMPE
jgi:predicted unusual protein kinase regulating ubiquinone biosynthesis (AarF/ABC1/UbiB family)/CBS domain-containing protein